MRSWLSGWRMPIRMARWDVRRHRGRSLLIAVLVGLPVVLLTTLVTAALATTLSPRDAAAYLYGRGQAIVSSPLQTPIIASPDRRAFTGGPVNSDGTERLARPIPGWSAGNETAALSELLHGTAHLITTEQTQVTTPTGQVKGVDILGADGRQAALAGRVTLDGGRWPATRQEVLVTSLGRAQGIPETGTLTRPDSSGKPVTLTIVGTGEGYTGLEQFVRRVDLVTLPAEHPVAPVQLFIGGVNDSTVWIVDRPEPLGYAEQLKLSEYGLDTTSRLYLTTTPTDEDWALAAKAGVGRDVPGDSTATQLAYLLMGAVALFVVTCLLAGPAFAVSAARQRRNLAQLAANGGTRIQLRRVVLAQALLLGVLAALVAGALGIAIARVLTAYLEAHDPETVFGGFAVPWLPWLLVVLTAVICSVGAALLPARGLGKLDLVGILRGQSVTPRLHRGLPVAGVALAAVGSVAVLAGGFANPRASWRLYAMPLGALALVVGALMLVPLVLVLLGRLLHHAPLSMRLASRDATRARGRTTPTVAAIMACAILLSTVAVAVASDDAQERRAYVPRLPLGWGQATPGPWSSMDPTTTTAAQRDAQIAATSATIRTIVPGASIVLAHDLGREDGSYVFGPGGPTPIVPPTGRLGFVTRQAAPLRRCWKQRTCRPDCTASEPKQSTVN